MSFYLVVDSLVYRHLFPNCPHVVFQIELYLASLLPIAVLFFVSDVLLAALEFKRSSHVGMDKGVPFDPIVPNIGFKF